LDQTVIPSQKSTFLRNHSIFHRSNIEIGPLRLFAKKHCRDSFSIPKIRNFKTPQNNRELCSAAHNSPKTVDHRHCQVNQKSQSSPLQQSRALSAVAAVAAVSAVSEGHRWKRAGGIDQK
jgi:hypothetical protein